MKHYLGAFFVIATILLGVPLATIAASLERQSYIVVLHDNVKSPKIAAREIAAKVGGNVGFVYEFALKGFSISVPAQAVEGLRHNPQVKYLAKDDVRYAFEQTVPTGIQRIFADTNTNIGINGEDDYRVNADVAVIDTGIDMEHPDLNVAGGVNCTGNPVRAKCVAGGDDDHYHGTHVAGIIGALDNDFGVVGVAPGARLWAVKVLNSQGAGYSSWIIAGIDWVAQNSGTIEVANMSLGGSGFNQAEYDAIQGAVDKGVAFAVAAGNEDDDALNYSPAAFDNVLTVSALADFDGIAGGESAPSCRVDQDDTLADFSNWGPAVDIASPGVCINSTFPLEQGGYGTISGTSMASPHVAGALALLASIEKPGGSADVHLLYDLLKSQGNYNWFDDSNDGNREPLLDVSTIEPTMIQVGSSNNAPIVTIDSPSEGALFNISDSIKFSATVTDDHDIDLGIDWTEGESTLGSGDSITIDGLAAGLHTITATATDNGGLSGRDSITIEVVSETGSKISLAVTETQVNKVKYIATLTWSGAVSTNVDIFRDDVFLTTTVNDGEYVQNLGKTPVSGTFKVCESGTENCSSTVSFSWP